MKNRVNRLMLVASSMLLALGLVAVANAGSLREAGSSGSAVTGALPGQVQWAYYQTIALGNLCFSDGTIEPIKVRLPKGTFYPDNLCNTASIGDNILRLVNPNGAADANLAGAKTQTVCAMIYVFDDDEEMGECCGCPLSSTQLATFSVEHNLTSNWGITGGNEGGINPINAYGSIAIVAAAPNSPLCVAGGGGAACNGGCDPTNLPGYSVSTNNNLLGSITHNQAVATNRDLNPKKFATVPISSIIEVPTFKGTVNEVGLFDDAGGDPTNLTYLQTQCGALVGNGTEGGICNCPTE